MHIKQYQILILWFHPLHMVHSNLFRETGQINVTEILLLGKFRSGQLPPPHPPPPGTELPPDQFP